MSLRLRLLLTLVPLFVLGLLAADVFTYRFLDSYLLQRADEQAFQAHSVIERYLRGDGRGFGGPGFGGPGNSIVPGTYGELRTSTGQVVAQLTSSDVATHPVLPANLIPGSNGQALRQTVAGTGSISSYRVYVDRINDGSGELVLAAVPLTDLHATLNHLLQLEGEFGLGVTVVLAVVSLLLVRQSLRPLERMGATARSIVAQGLNQRVAPATETSEVGRLGLALNQMLGELEAAFAARTASQRRLQQFVADASHELRTPLTSMRGYAELLRRGEGLEQDDILLAARRIEDESKRLGVLVDDLLLLARLDQGRALQHDRVDLESLVADACADARVVDPTREVTARALAPLIVDGDEMRLRQVIGNVIRNALVHTPAGTPVEVILAPTDSGAGITVIDHGPGIPAGDADRIFERFHRADPEQSGDQGGSGLGLSIAAAVVAAHGGRISVHETAGGGATFRIELPLPPGEHSWEDAPEGGVKP